MADSKSKDKSRLIRSFARLIHEIRSYIPGPDMGTDEECMAWMYDEIHRAVGLPRVLGGIPLDEIGATGYGLAQCAEVAAPFCSLKLQNATVAIEGFGNVGRPAALFLEKMGCRLVAASDSKGGIYDPNGIDIGKLNQVKHETGSVVNYGRGQKLTQAELLEVHCDVLIPAARPDCIHANNAKRIQAKLILQGANIPATAEAESILHQRGILVVPDFIANAGGVICAAVEYHGGSEGGAFEQIAQKIRQNTELVLSRSREEKIEPRRAAVELARERVQQAMKFRERG
jgi:glutamate dehydrogenase/leucine dehydrogenase